MNKLSLIIFDLDDTLIHSNIDYATMKKRIVDLFEINELPNRTLTIKELLEKLDANKEKLQQANAIIESMEAASSATAEPIPFASELPALLKEINLLSVVLTNNSRQSVNNYLTNEKLQYLQEFKTIITRDDVSAMKPDPAGLFFILQKFNSNKSEVVYIGDSYIDAEAAQAAGIRFILVNYRNLDVDKFTFRPWKIFSSLAELIPFIRNELIDCVF